MNAPGAATRPLYVRRELLNALDIVEWAGALGLELAAVPAHALHVTIAYSRKPVDWRTVCSAAVLAPDRVLVAPSGARFLRQQGARGAVVLTFQSDELAQRHQAIIRETGASWDFDTFEPHVTIGFSETDIDLTGIQPFDGSLIFGPEIFEDISRRGVSDDGWREPRSAS